MMNATRLPVLAAPDFAIAEFAPLQPLLDPLVRSDTLGLLYGPSGVGKSFLALGIAWAAASGGSFLGWRAARPHKVFYIEGAMAPAETQRRLALFGAHPPTLEVLLPALDKGRPFDLRRIETQQRLMENWNRPELVVVDGLTGTGRSGDDDGWLALEPFLRVQRRYGRAVVMVHHANRKGLPRGSSRREDLLDLVVGLRRPADWRASDGARFEVHFEKTRAIHGALLAPMVAQLETADGLACWRWSPADTDRFDRGVVLLTRGLSVEAMGRALGLSRASAFRLQREARARARLPQRKLRGAAA